MSLWQTPLGPMPPDKQCIPVNIPNSWDWERLLLGAIDALSHEYNWEQSPGGLTPAETANAWRKVMVTMVGERCEEMIYPITAFLPGTMARKTSPTGTLTNEQGSTFVLGMRTYINPTAVGNTLRWDFLLKAGSYELRTVIQRLNSSNGAIMDWFLDNALVIDNMSFLGSSANIAINTSINVATDGLHNLTCQVVSITGSAQLAPIHYCQLLPIVPDGGG